MADLRFPFTDFTSKVLHMVRIISGDIASTQLDTIKGDTTRPTTDRVKESIFSRLDSMNILIGSRVLDLFAGSGALGFEAVSRGSDGADFVEDNETVYNQLNTSQSVVKKGLENKNRTVRFKSYKMDVQDFLERCYEDEVLSDVSWDVIFIDPPYDVPTGEVNDMLFECRKLLVPDGLIVVERSSRDAAPELPPNLSIVSEQNYGETKIYMYELD